MERGTLGGRSHITVVGSCMYMASLMSSNPKSLKDIAEVVDCTVPTLRTAYRLLYEDAAELAKELGLPKGPEALHP